MVKEHKYVECDECAETFTNNNHINEHLDITKHKSSVQEEDLDVSLDEERLAWLQKDMEAAEAAGGFTY